MDEYNHYMERERENLRQQRREDRLTIIIVITLVAAFIIGGVI